MPVAPSFKDFPIVRTRYSKNGKDYVDVKNEKTGTIRSVRWYTDTEYAKAYGKKIDLTDNGSKNMKRVRGFEKGPILVIRNARPDDEDWLKQSIARYAVGIGWHIVSTDELPADAPKHLQYILLGWGEASRDEHHMKTPSELANIISTKAKRKEWLEFDH